MDAYLGVNGKAKKVVGAYVGVAGKAQKVVRGYVGVNGKAQLFYQAGGIVIPSSLILLKSKAESHSSGGDYGYTATEMLISTDHGNSFRHANTIYHGDYAGDYPYNVFYDEISEGLYLSDGDIQKVSLTDSYPLARYGSSGKSVNLGIAHGKVWSIYMPESTENKTCWLSCRDLVSNQVLTHTNNFASGKNVKILVPRSRMMVAYDNYRNYVFLFNFNPYSPYYSEQYKRVYSYTYIGTVEISAGGDAFTDFAINSQGSSSRIYGSYLGTPSDSNADVFLDYMSVYGHNKGFCYAKPIGNVYRAVKGTYTATDEIAYGYDGTYLTLESDTPLYYNHYRYIPTITSNQISWKRTPVSTLSWSDAGVTPIPANISGDVYTNIISDGSYFYVIARTRDNFLLGMNGAGVNGCPGATSNTAHKVYKIDPNNITATPTLIYEGENDEFLTIAYANDKGTYYIPGEF